jgi:hypothetical protein
MAVLRNRYPLNIPPSGADPLLIEDITLDPGRYFLEHWMRVLPIENSARGGFIPFRLKRCLRRFRNVLVLKVKR